jgi:hypothetical protein
MKKICHHPIKTCTSPAFCKTIAKCRYSATKPKIQNLKPSPRLRVSAAKTLSPELRHQIILSALSQVEKNWIVREARRLHETGIAQTLAIKQALGIGGVHGGDISWDSHPKGLRVDFSDLIIPWSDLVPYVWPPQPPRLRVSAVKAASVWSAL